MSYAKIDQRTKSFFEEPTNDKFVALQQAAFVDEGYEPSGRSVLQLESEFDSANPAELLRKLEDLRWLWRLCPRFHFVNARICEQLNDQASLKVAVQRMQICLRALLETGDGTKNNPIAITFQCDQRDIFRVIGEEIRQRELVDHHQGLCEVVTAHSSVDVWFDVAPLVESVRQSRALLTDDQADASAVRASSSL